MTTIFLLPFLLAAAPGIVEQRPDETPPPASVEETPRLAQVSIEQRIIIRIPTMPMRPAPSAMVAETAPPPVRWKESKGPKCLPLTRIRGAVITPLNGVTMVTGTPEQFRAHFGRACRPADFYAGFYIQPNKDGALCAGRDTLHARNGSTCEIEKFSLLTAEPDGPDSADPRPPRGKHGRPER